MEFRTAVGIKKQEPDINYSSRIMMFGSCFTENIGKKLQEAKFQTLINPSGILYNPESIRSHISRILEKRAFTEDEIFEHESVWKSFDHHSRFATLSPEAFLDSANRKLEEAAEFLKKTDFLIITFGTSWIYRLKESGRVVANCHKLPANNFIREKLNQGTIVESYSALIQELLKVSPEIKIIFTVSPIRHWKDGAHENQLSKATLLLAIEELQQLFPENTSYFPAYEIVMDELRDYRFYAEDMIHTNEITINYIWKRFADSFFSKDTTGTISEIEKLVQATRHRPFNPQSDTFRQFIRKNIALLEKFEKKYPYIDFGAEREYFEQIKKTVCA